MKFLEAKALTGPRQNKAIPRPFDKPAPQVFNATDAAQDLAKEAGIDLAKVKGTGGDGRITKTDVADAIDSAK